MYDTKPIPDVAVWMTGDFDVPVLLHDATVTEHLGELTEMQVRFEAEGRLPPATFLGRVLRVHVEREKYRGRSFSGICTAVDLRIDGNTTFVQADVRPWFWMLTRNRNSRIFQDQTVSDIIRQVFSDAGFADYSMKLSRTLDKRVYCVQYRESDFDFLSRLMEQEGIYYYVPSEPAELDAMNLILCDDMAGHSPVPDYAEIKHQTGDTIGDASDDQIAYWHLGTSVLAGKVTLDDYNFLRPGSDLTKVNIQKSGVHSYGKSELYDHPGRHVIDDQEAVPEGERGDHLARVLMEAEALKSQIWHGRTGVRMMGVGRTFKMTEHPVKSTNKDYLVVSAHHRIEADYGRDFDRKPDPNPVYTCDFSAIPSEVPYRSAARTQWPSIAGLQTATVVGPGGEEIYTDDYGRIKVQFHWDREGDYKETASCWVRVVTPWAGNNWGMIHIPRIGQEVVIQFEEGDPDRPICTGMLYNGDNKPPYPLPEDQTRSGIRTDSSKNVRDRTAYNELMFEDKNGSELLSLQAQKHHEMLVKNKSSLTIGYDDLDYGDHDGDFSLSTVIKQNVSEKITHGDKFRMIARGSETVDIAKDKTQTIKGKHTKTVTGNDTTTVKRGNMSMTVNQGNHSTEVKMGNHSTEVKMGNHSTDVKMGNVDVKAALGKITHEALQAIELKVGANSIKIDQTGITIKGLMVKIEGMAMTEIKAPMTQVKGDAVLILKGGVTMIN